ncbi:putative monodehydroascorbate reductase (NADH) [Helianthus annuus]|uniref:Monodehydroascorbate reductase (NADH) n=1 Tax=Helianthus annuus TaxID=4232 RepID=A0A251S3F6_HELAN|nr:thioredoxin H-type 2 [Helianthus annuus]KAF5762370.1 putative monodehydroascorbate reductase (NADH) [Helianthus annuus]KAJ0445405.1 putative monodehydroascorbate reductase (NADH) [Helianthus annuus]KAJ0642888.1 putative monodehydroascorbate reductase (NADH) [Helianthus annuus]KAJ0823492.1 putative monodehydroascorbate reductase (NADH) [Helianthus annuus]
MGEEGQVISCHTVDAWNHHIKKDKNKLIVVDFAASWCGPCKVIAPFVAELAKSMPHVTFLKVDVDELKEIASDWEVEAMPTFLLLKNEKTVAKVVGAKKDELQQTIIKHSGNTSISG